MTYAFFDFDETITSRDTFIGFIYFNFSRFRVIVGYLVNGLHILAWHLGLLSTAGIKERLITHFFKGMSENEFKERAQRYGREFIPTVVLPQARERIKWHQEQGHTVVVVSASLQDYLAQWCQEQKVELLCTRLLFVNEMVTGKSDGADCSSDEKARRIKESYDLESADYVYAYGNSSDDEAMLALADEAYYQSFTEVREK